MVRQLRKVWIWKFHRDRWVIFERLVVLTDSISRQNGCVSNNVIPSAAILIGNWHMWFDVGGAHTCKIEYISTANSDTHEGEI